MHIFNSKSIKYLFLYPKLLMIISFFSNLNIAKKRVNSKNWFNTIIHVIKLFVVIFSQISFQQQCHYITKQHWQKYLLSRCHLYTIYGGARMRRSILTIFRWNCDEMQPKKKNAETILIWFPFLLDWLQVIGLLWFTVLVKKKMLRYPLIHMHWIYMCFRFFWIGNRVNNVTWALAISTVN